TIPQNSAFQTKDLDAYDSNCDDISSAKAESQDAGIQDSNSFHQMIYCVIAKELDEISVIDDEETLILEEESRSKMLDKQNDSILQGEGPTECISKAMAFLSAVTSRFPPSKNQLRTLPIPKIRQPFKMEEAQFNKFKEDKLRVLLALETEELLQPQGETMQLVKKRNYARFKKKLMLAEAQEAGQILDEEKLAFIADPGIAKV
nr:hypothetical protein [Tanacetum cinerariifolium]